MVRLSVNVNKVATLRNSRGGSKPSVLDAARTCIEAGAHGITVHPRADERHIRPADVREIAGAIDVEFNIEGDGRPGFLDLVMEIKPDQCTLVPVTPGEVTSDHGWNIDRDGERLKQAIDLLQSEGIRVSIFMDADLDAIDQVPRVGPDRIELYTAPYAWAKAGEERDEEYCRFAAAAERAASLGFGVNAGHDLNLENLPQFRHLPGLLEVSIGHHIISHALYVGLRQSIQDYLEALGHNGDGI